MAGIEVTDTEGEYHALESLLSTRLYEFNAAVTGVKDARYLGLVIRDSENNVVAGVAGHTWNGSCFLGYVWVKESERGKGHGRLLLRAVEEEARSRNCQNIVLSTNSFQSPGFYQQMGFVKTAEVPNHPVGHSNIWYTKALAKGL